MDNNYKYDNVLSYLQASSINNTLSFGGAQHSNKVCAVCVKSLRIECTVNGTSRGKFMNLAPLRFMILPLANRKVPQVGEEQVPNVCCMENKSMTHWCDNVVEQGAWF